MHNHAKPLRLFAFLFSSIWLATLASDCLSAPQDSGAIKTAVESFLQTQTTQFSGQVSISVGEIKSNASRPACSRLEASFTPGARNIGRTTVLVRCKAEANWSLYVPAQVKVIADYLVTTHALAQGQTIGEGDITRQTGDLGEFPAGVITNHSEVLGKTTAMSVPSGRPLRPDMIRQPPVVLQGQSVKVVSKGASFQVQNEGKALSSASEGKVVQVRLGSGQIVSGLAREGGIVEIVF